MAILPSLDQQLRNEREATESKFVVSHIDTCLSSYLNDHHNRDGELLLGVFVDADSTIGEVLDGLADEFRQIGWELGEDRLGFDYDAAKAAIDHLKIENADRLERLFDSSLDRIPEGEEDMHEMCQAWFLIHWDVPEEEDGASA